MIVVFGLKFLMRNRQPFSLFVPLNIWNFILAAFSIIGTIKLFPDFVGTIQNKGLQSEYLPYSHFQFFRRRNGITSNIQRLNEMCL